MAHPGCFAPALCSCLCLRFYAQPVGASLLLVSSRSVFVHVPAQASPTTKTSSSSSSIIILPPPPPNLMCFLNFLRRGGTCTCLLLVLSPYIATNKTYILTTSPICIQKHTHTGPPTVFCSHSSCWPLLPPPNTHHHPHPASASNQQPDTDIHRHTHQPPSIKHHGPPYQYDF